MFYLHGKAIILSFLQVKDGRFNPHVFYIAAVLDLEAHVDHRPMLSDKTTAFFLPIFTIHATYDAAPKIVNRRPKEER